MNRFNLYINIYLELIIMYILYLSKLSFLYLPSLLWNKFYNQYLILFYIFAVYDDSYVFLLPFLYLNKFLMAFSEKFYKVSSFYRWKMSLLTPSILNYTLNGLVRHSLLGSKYHSSELWCCFAEFLFSTLLMRNLVSIRFSFPLK